VKPIGVNLRTKLLDYLLLEGFVSPIFKIQAVKSKSTLNALLAFGGVENPSNRKKYP